MSALRGLTSRQSASHPHSKHYPTREVFGWSVIPLWTYIGAAQVATQLVTPAINPGFRGKEFGQFKGPVNLVVSQTLLVVGVGGPFPVGSQPPPQSEMAPPRHVINFNPDSVRVLEKDGVVTGGEL